ncbi:hypothetical protein C8T65DRAFT_657038 [Cerioporus squamosus]|nr:hypothetical protein C8T65DRAFT_657038 [Cerioporus squamosus]
MSYSYGHSALIRNPSRAMMQNYCIMASSALLWYDFGLTFTTEIQRVWHREVSCVSVAYLLMRYSALVDRTALVLEIVLWNAKEETCSILTHLDDILFILNLLATAVIVVIRVYGVSAKNWRWLPIVLPLNLVRPILYAIESARYHPVQGGPPFGCTYEYTLSDTTLAQFTTISSATMLVSHGILVLVTFIKTFSIKRHSWGSRMRTPLATLLLRDGIVFLVILIFTVFANFYATPKDSATIFLVWPYFYEIVNVIILSHFILDARGLRDAPMQDPYATTTSLPIFELPKIAPTATPEPTYPALGNLTVTAADASEDTCLKVPLEDPLVEDDVHEAEGGDV